MRAMVTGGLGYIGRAVCSRFLQEGWQVTAVDRLTPDQLTPFCQQQVPNNPNFRFESWDLLNPPLAFSDYDVYVHLAASISVAEAEQDPAGYLKNNVGSLVNLLGCIPKNRPVILASSIAASDPLGVYAKSKKACEDILLACKSVRGRVVLRFCNVTGAGLSCPDFGTSTHLIPRLVKWGVTGGDPVTLYCSDQNPAGTLRDYIHVDDVADRVLLYATAATKLGESVIADVGTGVAHSTGHVFDRVLTLTGATGLKVQLAESRGFETVCLEAGATAGVAWLGGCYRSLDEIIQSLIPVCQSWWSGSHAAVAP